MVPVSLRVTKHTAGPRTKPDARPEPPCHADSFSTEFGESSLQSQKQIMRPGVLMAQYQESDDQEKNSLQDGQEQSCDPKHNEKPSRDDKQHSLHR